MLQLIIFTTPVRADQALPESAQATDQSLPRASQATDNRQILLDKSQLITKPDHHHHLVASGPAGKTLIWKSSDPAVAEVTGDGEVAAKAAGHCQIIASVADDPAICAVCSIAVSPRSTTDLMQVAEKTDQKTISIKWKKAAGATSYRIYLRKKGEEEFTLYKTQTSAKAKLKGLKKESGYQVRVTACIDTPYGLAESDPADALSVYTAPAKPGKTAITGYERKKITFFRGSLVRIFSLRWKKAKGANCYKVYAKQPGKKKPLLLATTKKCSASLYGGTGHSYSVYVVPCRKKHGVETDGKKSKPCNIDLPGR
ncbi:MAG: hypothetical protein K5739_04985 [Lachnospiraceae bacterium]|nr:hypothetical protein [Lachnospiraceae bacterium]